MTADSLVGALGLYAGTAAVAALSAVFPLASIEVFLVALMLARPQASVVSLVAIGACATIGQLAGKLPIYAAARGATALPGPQRARIERLRSWLGRAHPAVVLAASAVVGIPPFSIMATAAGALAIRTRTFCAIVLAGRAAHFAIIMVIVRG